MDREAPEIIGKRVLKAMSEQTEREAEKEQTFDIFSTNAIMTLQQWLSKQNISICEQIIQHS